MRLRTALIAAALLAPVASGCHSEPPYNTLTEVPPGGDPEPKPPATKGGRAKAPKPPGTKAGPHADVDDIQPAPASIPAQSKGRPKR